MEMNIIAVTRNRNNVKQKCKYITVVEKDIIDDSIDWYAALEEPDALIHLAWGGLPN